MVRIGHSQTHLESPDVTLGAAHVSLRRESAVYRSIKDGSLDERAGGQFDWQSISKAHTVDVGFFDIDLDPQIVAIDERHDRLADRHDLALTRGADVHHSISRCPHLCVPE